MLLTLLLMATASLVVVVHRKLGYFEIYNSKQVVNGTKLGYSKRKGYTPMEELNYVCSDKYIYIYIYMPN